MDNGVTIRHALSACLTLLLVATAWDSGNAFVHHHRSQRSTNRQDSLRLLKLRLLAKELNSRMSLTDDTEHHSEPESLPKAAWRLVRSLASASRSASSEGSRQHKRDQVLASSSTFVANSRHTREQQLIRWYRSISAMDNFRIDYKELYNALTSFVSMLSTRYVPGAPAELQDVMLIPTIMPPNDLDIITGNVDRVVNKTNLVVGVTRDVLLRIPQFVQAQYQAWLQAQSSDLDWLLSVVEMTLVNLQISGSNNDGSSITSSGLSGVNIAVQIGLTEETLTRLINLIKILRAGIQS